MSARRLQLWLAGLGLIAYAVGLSLEILGAYAPTVRLAQNFYDWQRLFVVLPAFFWLAAMVWLIPSRTAWEERFARQKTLLGLCLAGILLYGAGIMLLVVPFGRTPPFSVMLAIGVDLWLLGVAVTMIDASDQGEAWQPHFFRSLDYSLVTAVLFGGQVLAVMAFGVGYSYPLIILLLSTVTVAILLQTFTDPVQAVVDQIAFFNAPQLRQARSMQRAESRAAQRVDNSLNLQGMDPAEFARLTRRALSHMGNLPKLAANPLTRLPIIEQRLAQNGAPASTLARAAELKTLLTESIGRLKPRNKGDYGTTDEWRHYNALYYPYVLGLRPYRRHPTLPENGDETVMREMQAWFRRDVPQRTLYNWQTAAARLVARDLRERSRHILNE